MASTGSEAIMIELMKEGWDWIKSEQFQKREAKEALLKETNSPMNNCVLKFDHFENIHRLPKDQFAIEGAPNLRQVPGYLVFGTGQPTKEGFQKVLQYLLAETGCFGRPAQSVLWTNMRQEPVVYMNGQSFTPRLKERMNENMEFPGAAGDYIEWLQNSFVKVIQKQIDDSYLSHNIMPKEDRGKSKKSIKFKQGPWVKYYRDTYAEHPEDRENIEYKVNLENDDALVTLNGLYDQMKSLGFELSYFRLPIVDEKAPRDFDFDAILTEMLNTTRDTACIFNCQMGKGRTTTGMILACLLKDILFGNNDIIYYKDDKVSKEEFPDEDEYLEERAKKGQYEVIDKIAAYLSYLDPGVDEAKAHIDHIIDLCGEKPSGTGLQNLRECILWTQTKHDFEPKKKRPFWKQMSKNFIERYCYLVVFTTYVKAFHSRGFDKCFTHWFDERAELRVIIANGVKDFNWI